MVGEDRQTQGISDREFHKLRDLIGSELGLVIAPTKRVMVETRLWRRARALGMGSIGEYCDYIHSTEGRRVEWQQLVDAITTHKTDFFRESSHFDYLVEHAVPELAETCGAGSRRPLLVWSSACSTGEEPYTTAMVLSDYGERLAPGNFWFQVLGTDISTGVLETARTAVYSEDNVRPVPEQLRRRYLLRSKKPGSRAVRLAPAIRSRVEFRQLNLLDSNYGFEDPFDVVFCRNVMIYFDRPTQQKVLYHISMTLRAGGYLLMGHSESLNGLELPLVQVEPTIYRRVDA